MDGYEVEIEALRRAADAACSAGEQAGEIRTNSAVTAVPAAMPGSESSSALPAWADWFDRNRLHRWSMAATRHGEQLNASADLYAANEEEAERAFNRPDARRQGE